MNPLFRIDFSISDSLKIVRKSVLIYETIIKEAEAAFMERETKILHKKFEAEKEKLCAQFVAERSREYNSSTEQEA